MFQLVGEDEKPRMRRRERAQTVHVGRKVHREIKFYAKRHHMTMADVMRDAWDEFKKGGKI